MGTGAYGDRKYYQNRRRKVMRYHIVEFVEGCYEMQSEEGYEGNGTNIVATCDCEEKANLVLTALIVLRHSEGEKEDMYHDETQLKKEYRNKMEKERIAKEVVKS